MKSWIAAAAVSACVTAGMALPNASSDPDAAAQTDSMAGQVIFIDPATGQLREPTSEEWLQLPKPVRSKALNLPRVLPDGTLVMPAEAAMQEMFATIGPDNSLQIHCNDQPAEGR